MLTENLWYQRQTLTMHAGEESFRFDGPIKETQIERGSAEYRTVDRTIGYVWIPL